MVLLKARKIQFLCLFLPSLHDTDSSFWVPSLGKTSSMLWYHFIHETSLDYKVMWHRCFHNRVLERGQHIMCIYLLRFPRLYTTPPWRIIYFQTHHTLNLCNSKRVVYPVYCTVWFYQEWRSIVFCHMKKLLIRSTKGLDGYRFYLMHNDKLYINTQSQITYF